MTEIQRVKLDLNTSGIVVQREVEIPRAQGEPLKITFDFKHRTRRAMNAFNGHYVETLRDITRKRVEVGESVEWEGEQFIKLDVDSILEAATGWNAERDFERDALDELLDAYPAAASAILSAYRVAIAEGRSGN